MKIFLEGEQGRALCEHCQQLVTTVYTRRNVPFSDGQGEARDILVGVCSQCDSVVAIPPQSTPSIKEARKQLVSIEARLPAVYLDMLDGAMHAVTQEAGVQIRKLFLSYYFHVLAHHQAAAAGLPAANADFLRALTARRAALPAPAAASMKRLSMKVNPHVAEDFEVLLQATHLSQTDLLKAIICQIQADILEQRNPTAIAELQRLARVAL